MTLLEQVNQEVANLSKYSKELEDIIKRTSKLEGWSSRKLEQSLEIARQIPKCKFEVVRDRYVRLSSITITFSADDFDIPEELFRKKSFEFVISFIEDINRLSKHLELSLEGGGEFTSTGSREFEVKVTF